MTRMQEDYLFEIKVDNELDDDGRQKAWEILMARREAGREMTLEERDALIQKIKRDHAKPPPPPKDEPQGSKASKIIGGLLAAFVLIGLAGEIHPALPSFIGLVVTVYVIWVIATTR